jgi:hypothetical protein
VGTDVAIHSPRLKKNIGYAFVPSSTLLGTRLVCPSGPGDREATVAAPVHRPAEGDP